jgi:hypothetical protein
MRATVSVRVRYDAAAIETLHAGDHIEHCRFSGSGWAKQRSEAVFTLECDVESEVAALLDTATRFWMRRLRISETISATMAMIIETHVRRRACDSPPGTCV